MRCGIFGNVLGRFRLRATDDSFVGVLAWGFFRCVRYENMEKSERELNYERTGVWGRGTGDVMLYLS